MHLLLTSLVSWLLIKWFQIRLALLLLSCHDSHRALQSLAFLDSSFPLLLLLSLLGLKPYHFFSFLKLSQMQLSLLLPMELV